MKTRFLLAACLSVVVTSVGVRVFAEPPLLPVLEDPYIPTPATDEAYKNSQIAALHRLAESYWDSEHLAAFLDRNPKLVNERVTYKRPRKPLTTDNHTALHYAASAGNLESVKVLLAYKADVNARAELDSTPLHYAARYGHLSVCKTLVAAGAKPDAKTAALPEHVAPSGPPNAKPPLLAAIPAMTPLDLAKEGKHKDVIEYLSNLK